MNQPFRGGAITSNINARRKRNDLSVGFDDLIKIKQSLSAGVMKDRCLAVSILLWPTKRGISNRHFENIL